PTGAVAACTPPLSLRAALPIYPSGPGDTPSRRRLFVCMPDAPEEELDCAREILATLATRAYRRPVAADDPAIAALLELFDEGRRDRKSTRLNSSHVKSSYAVFC